MSGIVNKGLIGAGSPSNVHAAIGFMDYNDTASYITPIILSANIWTTLTNNGLGVFTNSTYKPTTITDLLNVSTGELDFTELELGQAVIIRNDFEVTPTTNNQVLDIRYDLGIGVNAYQLSTRLGRLDSGSGIPYKFALKPDYIYMGDENTKNNPARIQVRLSGGGSVVNNGSVIQVVDQ